MKNRVPTSRDTRDTVSEIIPYYPTVMIDSKEPMAARYLGTDYQCGQALSKKGE